MLKFRPTAALALVTAVAVCLGAFSCSAAAARPAPAQSGGTFPPATRPAVGTSVAVLRVAVARHYGEPGNASGFNVIIATGAGQAWAFGGTNPGGPSTPIAARWNGSTLTASALPGGLTGFINDASAPRLTTSGQPGNTAATCCTGTARAGASPAGGGAARSPG
jgi:hypothetical protein